MEFELWKAKDIDLMSRIIYLLFSYPQEKLLALLAQV